MTKQVENLMKALDITEEEALQVIADDKAIDKGEKLFELSAEQEKASKKAKQGKPTESQRFTSLTLPKGKDLRMLANDS